MSYILDALRKSETERRQGKIPDLGQQVQLIHRPRKKRISPVVWVAVALVLNAIVLAVVFWPLTPVSQPDSEMVNNTSKPDDTAVTAAELEAEPTAIITTVPEPVPEPVLKPEPISIPQVISEEPVWEQPTIIVPSAPLARDREPLPDDRAAGRVPHLVELPLSFQKSVPDLIFNSHIYASDPSARRVMINDNYLRRGDSFSGLKVENITEDGVVLSKHGRRFRVGTVRDWVSPH